MSANERFNLFSAALIAYLVAMVVRHVYLGYFKFPRLIEHYRRIGDDTNVAALAKSMQDSKKKYIWRNLFLAIAAAFLLGVHQLGVFFISASQP